MKFGTNCHFCGEIEWVCFKFLFRSIYKAASDFDVRSTRNTRAWHAFHCYLMHILFVKWTKWHVLCWRRMGVLTCERNYTKFILFKQAMSSVFSVNQLFILDRYWQSYTTFKYSLTIEWYMILYSNYEAENILKLLNSRRGVYVLKYIYYFNSNKPLYIGVFSSL